MSNDQPDKDGLPEGIVGENDLLRRAPITRQTWAVMQAAAGEFIKAGLARKGDTEGALILKIQSGREIGLPSMASMQKMYVIDGRVALEGVAMLGLVLADPRCERADVGWDQEKQRGYFHSKRSQPLQEASYYFSMEDAARAGLSGKDTWQKYPQVMAPYRALAIGSRFMWADVLLGIYLPEELGAEVAVTPNGQVRVLSTDFQDAEPPPEEPVEESDEQEALVSKIHMAGIELNYSQAKINSDIRQIFSDGKWLEDLLDFYRTELAEQEPDMDSNVDAKQMTHSEPEQGALIDDES